MADTVNRLVVGSNPTARATSILPPNAGRLGRRAALARLAVLAGGCALGGAGSAAPATGGTVTIGWRRDAVTDLALPAAIGNGLLAQYGIEVRLVETEPDATALPALLADRRVDAAIAPVLLLLAPLRQGLDARLTAGISAGGLRLLADRHAGLHRIEDVKHKRVGVTVLQGPAQAFFSILARRKGVDPFKEIEWVAVPLDQEEAALRSQRVDAVALPDPYAFALMQRLKLVEIATSLTGFYRERTASVLVCGGALIRERPRIAADLTTGLLRAANWIGRSPDAAVSLATPLAPMVAPAQIPVMLRSGEGLDEHPAGQALVDDVASYADELRLLGTFPFELQAERFASGVCADLAHPASP